MDWVKPATAKLPYSPFKKWAASPFARKIRAALGMRVDEDGNNCTYRKKYKVASGDVKPENNICHHFEQDQEGANAVKFTVAKDGDCLKVVLPATSADRGDVMRVEDTAGTLIFRITAAGAFSTSEKS